jgi:hypothetical protein
MTQSNPSILEQKTRKRRALRMAVIFLVANITA